MLKIRLTVGRYELQIEGDSVSEVIGQLEEAEAALSESSKSDGDGDGEIGKRHAITAEGAIQRGKHTGRDLVDLSNGELLATTGGFMASSMTTQLDFMAFQEEFKRRGIRPPRKFPKQLP